MIILKNLSSVPDMILLIISDAFRIESGLGGIIGFLGCKTIREGYSRGILSNEAGSGTSGIAHADSGILNPANAALMGIVEVVFDTGFMCMLTAWAVILSVPNPTDFTGGMSLILTAFSTSLSPTASYILVFLTFIYAYSTVICWYHYGVESIYALFGRESKYIYLLIFTFACVALSVIGNRPLIYLTDIVILLMSVITLLTLIKNSDRIVFLSEKGGILNRRIKGNGFLKELKFHSRK
jgi:AGCS family alanine or glycine:cation symporter